jgi:O-antigen ligase
MAGESVIMARTGFLLGLILFIAPAVGVPSEYMLQDTLKSMVVSLGVLGLVAWYLRACAGQAPIWHWHAVLLFPLGVGLYALGSVFWATNTYLAWVETARWLVFATLLWLGVQVISRSQYDRLALWIHAGAVATALWGLLQFWLDLRIFPQGHSPASTFVNRNFAAEFVVVVFPLSVHALLRTRSAPGVAVLSYSLALNLVFVLACATRSALVALVLTLVPLCVGGWLFRRQLAWAQWERSTRWAAVVVFVAAFLTLGLMRSANPAGELAGLSAVERTMGRAQTLSAIDRDPSAGMRWTMWRTTLRMIQDRPWSGVGAGNWEVAQPLYQPEGVLLETDYYAHNEFLQHVAEYGVLGWVTVTGLVACLAWAAMRTWRMRALPDMAQEGLLRTTALCSLFALFVVSCAGFPWRMAATGALFAVGLAAVAASDVRLGCAGWTQRLRAWQPGSRVCKGGALAAVLAWLIAAVVSYQAALCEYKIVHAAKLALGVSASSDPQSPQWNDTKQILLQSLREGMAINPHYRKLTPMAADEMALWGDWPHAVEVWESVLRSRPYLTGLMLNVARGRAAMGEYEAAMQWVQKVRTWQPVSAGARSVELYVLDQTGRLQEAAVLGRLYMQQGTVDADMASNLYRLGIRLPDPQLALDALAWRTRLVPHEVVINHLKAAELHDKLGQTGLALERYRQARRAAPEQMQQALGQKIPRRYFDKL